MKNKNSKIGLFILGILGCCEQKYLSKFGVSKKTIKNMIAENMVSKKCIILNDKSIMIYLLTETGIRAFKKYYKDYDIGNSCSIIHDYIHCVNILSRVNNIDDLYSYKNEKAIREKYKNKIKDVETQNRISISCPDCFLILDGEKIFIETLVTTNKKKQTEKANFKYVIEDDSELLILKY